MSDLRDRQPFPRQIEQRQDRGGDQVCEVRSVLRQRYWGDPELGGYQCKVHRGARAGDGARPAKRVNSDAKRAAVGYIRTSTEKQEDSPEAQKLALEAWGRVNGFELRSFYVERVSSGVRLFERTALLDAIEDLKAGEMVVAVARDRFSRNTAKMVMIEHLVERAGAYLYCCQTAHFASVGALVPQIVPHILMALGERQ